MESEEKEERTLGSNLWCLWFVSKEVDKSYYCCGNWNDAKLQHVPCLKYTLSGTHAPIRHHTHVIHNSKKGAPYSLCKKPIWFRFCWLTSGQVNVNGITDFLHACSTVNQQCHNIYTHLHIVIIIQQSFCTLQVNEKFFELKGTYRD